ncbi:polyribonucleotide nucleotidyltransferase [Flavobacterium sp. GSP27]|uniref:Polyribonucleotide nucleotidyltransferase n=2 Tax=Flavobacterium TaxID=237 RepID=A0A432CKF5_9FLAO|nr:MULTISPECIES: polyribonucleotide nucleotidyltransferase [Flavobacterium]RTY93761.1 polyribonucleotide nucleotidyltransferase [Flavobacterium sp. GSN2]RTY68864.1 polyribonucleotide nucleotidyltransferase [Flavobacterium sp. LB2P53]RTY73740.1 polyribonucleotide nucleotidyltransferase [Flavobacterium sp. LS1R10]RTY79513.1 polyribonucleotide nucleotidyltransferase [Flavobacterium sp. LS1P28]RTY86722.1 polyribonucleotide nucleotidyltransferase [Flavobacterium sp. RSP15]
MIPKVSREIIDLGDGRSISIETGKLAKQADGAVEVRMGNAVLLATVVSARKASPGIDFLPLTLDYREKFAAAGRFPGGFFKREARPSDNEILTMRLVDRVLRPLFPKDYHAETQVMIQLMSHDENVMPDALAGLAASAALSLSDIPFSTLISEVRVARVDGHFIINPSRTQLELSDIDMMIGASKESIAMVEGEMKEISEAEMVEAIKFAHEAIKIQIAAQERLVAAFGKKEVRTYDQEREDVAIYEKVNAAAYDKCYAIAKQGTAKHERTAQFAEAKEAVKALFTEEELAENGDLVSKYFAKSSKEAVRNVTLDLGTRLDGRKTNQIRPIWAEVDYLPSVHGSALFTRGETQALATATLGTSREANQIDSPSQQGEEKFYLHYNFPPFSTGEAKPLRGTSRREVGHGNLAQRALKNMIPADCPYTIRIVSEVLESNGSSSMATVCAGTLALMDAGIQMTKPVSGIAMGLISDEKTGRFAVLSDILGDEDHLGDMDFKVTGTADGITACQMDIKIEGLAYNIMEEALAQAREGRLHILGKIIEVLAAPKADVKAYAPKIITRTIPGNFIGALIGPGGKVIQELQKSTGTTIVINEVNEQGVIEILGTDPAGIEAVLAKIESITFKPQMNEAYEVKVIKMLDFGAVVEYTAVPGNEVLLHVSELAWERTENVSDVVNMGDVFMVKYLGLDPKTRKEKVSRKALLPRPPREERKE